MVYINRIKIIIPLMIRLAISMLRDIWRNSYASKYLRKRKRLRLRGTTSAETLKAVLVDLGVGPGKVIFVHSSIDNLYALNMKPLQILDMLKTIISPGGTLCMPSFFLRGNFFLDYFENDRCFDPECSTTSSGLLNEFFRRQQGTLRSVHYTHSCCAWGEKARELVQDHEKSDTPFDKHSPFYKVVENDGLVILLGVGFEYCTMKHVAGSILGDEYPVQMFLPPTLARIRRSDKEERVPVRFQKFYVVQTMESTSWEKALEKKGILVKPRKDIGFPLSVVKARDCFNYMVEEARKGHTLFRYSDPPVTIVGI